MPALDGLRGLAIAGVLLFHADHLTGGYLGVDLFFVLSGFLITSLLLSEWQADGRISLARFWARRARRLLPALAGVLAGVAIYAAVWAEARELGRIRSDALATLGYVANWRAVFTGNGYWDVFAVPSPLEHTWSLAIEEQFYLVWPLAVLAVLWARRGSARSVLAMSLILGVASSAWMMTSYTPGGDPERVYLGTDTRGAAILFGAALAAAYACWGPPSRRLVRGALEVAGVVGAGVLAWAWFALDGRGDTLYRGGFLACGLAAVGVIAVAASPYPGPIARVLSFAPLRGLGAISYGLYLWHWPVYVVLTPERSGMDGRTLTAVRIGTSVAIAVVSYFLLELPIRRGGLPTLRARVLAPAAAALVVGAVVVATAGGTAVPTAPAAFSADTSATPPTAPQSVSRSGFSAPSDFSVDWAALAAASFLFPSPAPPAPKRVLVVGDSVAASLGVAMEDHAVEFGILAWNRSVVDCSLVPGGTTVRFRDGSYHENKHYCGETWAPEVGRFQPDIVLLLLGAPGFTEIRLADAWVHPCDPEYDRWYHDQLLEAVATLGAAGARVVIGTAPVPAAFGPVVELTGCLNSVHRQIAGADATAAVVDLDAYVCPGGTCQESIDGAELRPDGLHFEGEGAVIVSRWLTRRLLAVSV
ncbi:MAG: acyltransferase family protein [Actinomycetota bacterium]